MIHLSIDKILGFIPVMGVVPIPYIGNITIGLIYNIFLFFGFLFIVFTHLKNMKYYKNGFIKKNTVYLLGGPMGDGKTRFLTKLSSDIKSQENKNKNKINIICANYLNYNSDVFFSSREDFFYLQKDIQTLGLVLNFDLEEKKKIEKSFLGYFNYDEETIKHKKKLDKIKKLNKNIHFITLGDEFHLYFHNRSSLSNFSGLNGKKMLEMIHQTRHSNQLLFLATQDTDSLDLDFRQIADKEIEVKEWIFGIFYGFNLYKYLNLKYQNIKDNLFFHKINKSPYIFFNGYLFYQLIKKINKHFVNLQKFIYKYINKYFKKNLYKTYEFKNYFQKYVLPYNTKFNVNINLNCYKPGQLFDYILEKWG